ncbi:hypothetical protein [Brevibacterium sp.]|uniref:hypothetical protein n=1 Tax=Brevibacterium sp. TaxID=1701 RepID=UPI00281146B5|nr:hypothetical protein [Brevibacterium sp.]
MLDSISQMWSFAAPAILATAPLLGSIAVGIVVGRMSHRWSTDATWLQGEYERRLTFYEEASHAVQALFLAVPTLLREMSSQYDENGNRRPLTEPYSDGLVHSFKLMENMDAYDEIRVANEKWVAVKIRCYYFAPSVTTPAVEFLHQAWHDLMDEISNPESTWDQVLHLSELVSLYSSLLGFTLNRDALDLKKIAVKALPYRQRRAELRGIRDTSRSLESSIRECLAELEGLLAPQES